MHLQWQLPMNQEKTSVEELLGVGMQCALNAQERKHKMTIIVVTNTERYVFSEAKEVFIEECSLNIHQSTDDDYGERKGWIIENDRSDQ